MKFNTLSAKFYDTQTNEVIKEMRLNPADTFYSSKVKYPRSYTVVLNDSDIYGALKKQVGNQIRLESDTLNGEFMVFEDEELVIKIKEVL